MKITEDNIKNYIDKEVLCTATEEVVLLSGYRGKGLAQIRHPEKFFKGKYPHIEFDCLLCNLQTLD